MTENSIPLERQHAPHGPDLHYTADEIRHSMDVHGSDLVDMMLQQPDIYWGLAWERAEGTLARDMTRAVLRHAAWRLQEEIAHATELQKTTAGRLVARLRYQGEDWYPPVPSTEAS